MLCTIDSGRSNCCCSKRKQVDSDSDSDSIEQSVTVTAVTAAVTETVAVAAVTESINDNNNITDGYSNASKRYCTELSSVTIESEFVSVDELAAIDAVFADIESQKSTQTAIVTDIEDLFATTAPVSNRRYKPSRPLSVTDLSAQVWCEHQLHLSLQLESAGISPILPIDPIQQQIMQSGIDRHLILELSVHPIVPIVITSRADNYGLKLLNILLGIKELLLTGLTRELPVLGRFKINDTEYIWISGIIDEINRLNNNNNAQSSQSTTTATNISITANTNTNNNTISSEQNELYSPIINIDTELQIEELLSQESITANNNIIIQPLQSPQTAIQLAEFESAESIDTNSILQRQNSIELTEYESIKQQQQSIESNNNTNNPIEYRIIDNKTRSKNSLPSIAQKRTSRLQLQLYKQLFDSMVNNTNTTDNNNNNNIFQFNSSQFFSELELDPNYQFNTELQQHINNCGYSNITTLQQLFELMLVQLSSIGCNSSNLLTVEYEYQLDNSIIGYDKFEFNFTIFYNDLLYYIDYWRGLRDSESVSIAENWKCNYCQYLAECNKTNWQGKEAKLKSIATATTVASSITAVNNDNIDPIISIQTILNSNPDSDNNPIILSIQCN